jgi:hypothetical protein
MAAQPRWVECLVSTGLLVVVLGSLCVLTGTIKHLHIWVGTAVLVRLMYLLVPAPMLARLPLMFIGRQC